MQVTMQGVAWNSLGSGILFLWLSHVYTQINVAAMGGGECIYQTAKIAKNQLSEPGTGLAWPLSSPDSRPIKRSWDGMKQAWFVETPPCNPQDLKECQRFTAKHNSTHPEVLCLSPSRPELLWHHKATRSIVQNSWIILLFFLIYRWAHVQYWV